MCAFAPQLGGKSPCIVHESANLEHAAKRLVWATFMNGGQTCVRPDFLLVHQAVADRFISLLKATIKDFYGIATPTAIAIATSTV